MQQMDCPTSLEGARRLKEMGKVISNKCLICNSSQLHQLIRIEKFPLFFGAIPPDKKGDVEEFPLTISYCQKCGHFQQFDLVEEEIMNRVYDAEYYNCPARYRLVWV